MNKASVRITRSLGDEPIPGADMVETAVDKKSSITLPWEDLIRLMSMAWRDHKNEEEIRFLELIESRYRIRDEDYGEESE